MPYIILAGIGLFGGAAFVTKDALDSLKNALWALMWVYLVYWVLTNYGTDAVKALRK